MIKQYSKTRTRTLLASIATGAAISAAILNAPAAQATPQYCTPETPYPPYNGVCTGFNSYCFLGVMCSPVPGMPGTRNPDGYTPPNWRAR